MHVINETVILQRSIKSVEGIHVCYVVFDLNVIIQLSLPTFTSRWDFN